MPPADADRFALRIAQSIHDFSAAEWDALAGDHTCLSHAWLAALEDGGVIGPERGAVYRIPHVRDAGGRLLAAMPGVLKGHALGEYGPENLWLAQAQAAGIAPLPKWQFEVPLVPVAGPRLLAAPGAAPLADGMWAHLVELARRQNIAAITVARMPADEAHAAERHGYFLSHELGSQWSRQGARDYADVLARFNHRARNRIRRERRLFADSGLAPRIIEGAAIDTRLWDDFYRGYVAVCRQKKSRPLMTREFYACLAPLADRIYLIAGFRDGAYACGNLCVRSGSLLLGRTWSALEPLPWAAIELTLHRPIELACELGLDGVDGGVWGPHKASRGYATVALPNAHWLANPALDKVARELAQRHRDGFIAARRDNGDAKYLRREPA